MQGTDALQAYLGRLYEALPSFTLLARRRRQDIRRLTAVVQRVTYGHGLLSDPERASWLRRLSFATN